MDQWGKTKRLGHKGLEIILHHRPTWTPKLLWGIKIESYCVKHEAPLKFTLGAYSTGYSAYSLLLCCTHKDEVDKVWIFIIFHTHTHKWLTLWSWSYHPLSRNINESMTHFRNCVQILGKKLSYTWCLIVSGHRTPVAPHIMRLWLHTFC